MNWSRVRWLLIACILLIDLFLGTLLLRQYRGENIISRSAVENTAQLLAQAGISLDPDLVPSAMIKDYVYGIPMSEDAYRDAFAQMVGSSVTGVYLLPSSTGRMILFENGDRAEYYHNLYLTYLSRENKEKLPDDEESSEVSESTEAPVSTDIPITTEASSAADTAVTDVPTPMLTGETGTGHDVWEAIVEAYLNDTTAFRISVGKVADAAEAVAKAFLSAMTEDTGGGTLRLQPRTEGVFETALSNVSLVVFRETIVRGSGNRTQADIFGTRMCVIVEDGIVRYLAGTWVPTLPNETFDTKKLDQVNILFSELQRHTEENNTNDESVVNNGVVNNSIVNNGAVNNGAADSDNSGTNSAGGETPSVSDQAGDCTITNMERVYYMLWDDAGKLYLRPAWRFDYLTVKNDERIFKMVLCDAVTGSVVQEENTPYSTGEYLS